MRSRPEQLLWLKEAESRVLIFLAHIDGETEEAHELVKHLIQISCQIVMLENL